LHEDSHRYTHFTGFMLEEEIVAALWGSTSSASRNIFVWYVDTKFWGREFQGEREENSFDLIH
jgi:hypothetical protein